MKHMTSFLILALALFLVACTDSPTKTESDERSNVGVQIRDASKRTDTLRVGVVNCSVGWMAEDFILSSLSDSQSVYSALQTLYTQYQHNQPAQRMHVLAAYFALQKLDVIALQEVQSMASGDTLTEDFLQLLLDGLEVTQPQSQWTVVRQSINRTTLNVPDSTNQRMNLDFFEGNVLLVRNGITIVDTQSVVFDASMSFPLLGQAKQSNRGYQKVTLQSPAGARWEIYNTHLEVELLSVINVMQSQQLNAVIWDSWQDAGHSAQLVTGDLNSIPDHGGVANLTNTSTGLIDLWTLGDTPDEQSWTCCVEDFSRGTMEYDRRIDYVLGRNILSAQVQRITPWIDPLWGSDHAMLIATVVHQLED